MTSLSALPRVAIVHSYYSSRQPSGENVAVDQQIAALTARGCDVTLVSLSTDELEQRPLYSARAALTAATGAGDDPTRAESRSPGRG